MPTTVTGMSKTQVLDFGLEGGDQSPSQNIQMVGGNSKGPQILESAAKLTHKSAKDPSQIKNPAKLGRSKSANKQYDNMVKVAQQLGDKHDRPSMLKLYEEYLDNSSTNYMPDEVDFKYYKNIKD